MCWIVSFERTKLSAHTSAISVSNKSLLAAKSGSSKSRNRVSSRPMRFGCVLCSVSIRKAARARISFHEEERNGFRNVYLDSVSDPAGSAPAEDGDNTDPDESAWNTAIEAAPWVLGSSEPEREIPPEELFEKLEPFKRLVAEDIRHGGEDDADR